MRRPKVAIPEIGQDLTNYLAAAAAAGMEPVVVSVRSPEAEQTGFVEIQRFREADCDGLLLPGGGDVNPARYGQINQGSFLISDALDELQLELLERFVRCEKPVFGICRGAQLINVFFGGTLIQHLPTAFRHARNAEEPDKVHGAEAEKGSWIAELYGTAFAHNSAHHQAVDRLGEGLAVSSRCAEDGVVEALRHRSLPVYGVQWHPERMCLAHRRDDTVDGLSVFRFFCDVCAGGAKGGL